MGRARGMSGRKRVRRTGEDRGDPDSQVTTLTLLGSWELGVGSWELGVGSWQCAGATEAYWKKFDWPWSISTSASIHFWKSSAVWTVTNPRIR